MLIIFLYEHADFSAPLTKPTTKHLLAPIETGAARVFNLLHSSSKSQKLPQDKGIFNKISTFRVHL